MQRLHEVVWQREDCLVTDQPSLERMIADGSVVLRPEHRVKHRGPSQAADGTLMEGARRDKGGSSLSLLYAGLSLSHGLREAVVTPCLQEIHTALGSDSFITVHMRVEDDWKIHCFEVKHQHTHMVGNCYFDPKQVADKVLAIGEIRDQYKRVLLLWADNLLNNPDSVQQYWETLDPKQVWPDDWVAISPSSLPCFSPSRLDDLGLSCTQQSAASFFLAMEASQGKPYIGHSMSTQTLGMMVLRDQRGDKAGTYWYNCKSSPEKAMLAPPIMEAHAEVGQSYHYSKDPGRYCCPSTMPIETC